MGKEASLGQNDRGVFADANFNNLIVSAAMQPDLGLRGKLQSINVVRHEPKKETLQSLHLFYQAPPSH